MTSGPIRMAQTRLEIEVGRAAAKAHKIKAERENTADTCSVQERHECFVPPATGWRPDPSYKRLPVDPKQEFPEQVRKQMADVNLWFEPITITRAQLLKANTGRQKKAISAILGA